MKLHIYSRRTWLLGLFGGLPLCCKLPYMLNAWHTSPLDSIDWIFPILAMVMGFIVIVTAEPAWKYLVKTALVGAILCFLGFLAVSFTDSAHALAIILAIIFWWCIIWMLLGWRQAFTLIPPFAILLLATTSSTYWLCFFLKLTTVQAWTLKIAAAVVACILTILIIRYRWCWSQMNTLFTFAMIGAALLLFQTKSITRTYPSFLLTYKTVSGSLVGREPDPDASFQRFFSTSEAHSYEYASLTHVYNLLAVSCGSNIHEIHPASHCLRSSGWKIDSEQLIEVTVKDRLFNVTEVEASRGGNTLLVWVWYSTPTLSTGNFLGFRRLWNADAAWETYQLSVYHNGNLEESRQALVDFLETLPPRETAIPAEPDED